jgi:hypothetical protein
MMGFSSKQLSVLVRLACVGGLTRIPGSTSYRDPKDASFRVDGATLSALTASGYATPAPVGHGHGIKITRKGFDAIPFSGRPIEVPAANIVEEGH